MPRGIPSAVLALLEQLVVKVQDVVPQHFCGCQMVIIVPPFLGAGAHWTGFIIPLGWETLRKSLDCSNQMFFIGASSECLLFSKECLGAFCQNDVCGKSCECTMGSLEQGCRYDVREHMVCRSYPSLLP